MAFVALSSFGCHHGPARPKPITVVVDGEGSSVRVARRGLAAVREPDVAVTLAEPPARADIAVATGDVERRIAAARQSYVGGDFDGCVEALSASNLVGGLLGDQERSLAARVLFWRIACQVGSGDAERARRDARAFATFGLAIPADVSSSTPEVESVLAEGITAVSRAPRATLWADANVPGTASFDGRGPACRVACAVDLPPGDHVVRVAGDGAVPESRAVRLGPGGARIRLELARAGPDLAASQWAARYGARGDVDSGASLLLLGHALGAPRLVFMSVDRQRSRVRLRGTLVLRGNVAVQAERAIDPADLAGSASDLLIDLLERGRVVARPIWANTLFWVVVGATATVAAALSWWIFHEPNIRSDVGFGD